MSAPDPNGIPGRVAGIRARIEAAARRSGRDPGSVTLLAVTKTKPLEDALAAYAAGVRSFGENRVQEAEGKLPGLPPDAVKHLIGPLQGNKVNRAVKLFDCIQTVDREELARKLAHAAEAASRRLPVFVEVNSGGESTKAGVPTAETAALVEAVRRLPALDLRGLMTIPPPGEGRPHFAALRELAAKLGLPELSMGMSDDFEEAIEEGATVVRIGSALFGVRSLG
ncbi:MAG: YggS family pyridoxal phosphate-dependent enzyme [Acidobacteria bacterium]|nr:YggS family pyridoxal phosphate-dependent enzyme [Acidobacteriota bacterium]